MLPFTNVSLDIGPFKIPQRQTNVAEASRWLQTVNYNEVFSLVMCVTP